MIPRIHEIRQHPDWQTLLAGAIRSPVELLESLNLSKEALPQLNTAAEDFKVVVPQPYLERIQPETPNDPLLLQVLPQTAELLTDPGYLIDPVGDQEASVAPGLLHKYRSRALLTVTGACAIHCRYCFRRHFPYTEHNPLGKSLDQALAYLQSNPCINEIILSGGDPLVLDDERLNNLIDQLEKINHINTLRIHTRLPIVIPQRITPALITRLGNSRLNVVIVVHSNHAQELDDSVADAMARLKTTGATLLNQSVLLKGINDNSDLLAALSHRLFQMGVLPYYLHLLDRVQGAQHFDLDEAKAVGIYQRLQAQLPGYLLPKLVREIAGEKHKTHIFT